MKKLLFLLLTVSLSTVFAKGGHKSSEELCEIEHVVLLTDVTPEITRELFQGQLPSTAIECRENLKTWEKYKPTSASLDATIGISADKSHFLVKTSDYITN